MLVCNSGHEQPVDIPVLAQQWYPRWLPEGYERVREIWDNQEYINFYQVPDGGEFDTLIIRFGAITSGNLSKKVYSTSNSLFTSIRSA